MDFKLIFWSRIYFIFQNTLIIFMNPFYLFWILWISFIIIIIVMRSFLLYPLIFFVRSSCHILIILLAIFNQSLPKHLSFFYLDQKMLKLVIWANSYDLSISSWTLALKKKYTNWCCKNAASIVYRGCSISLNSHLIRYFKIWTVQHKS